MIDIDCRWKTLTGIGRYSRELTKLIDIPYREVVDSFTPSSIMGMTYGIRNLAKISEFFYSPGFMGIPGYKRQLLTLHDLIHMNDPHERNFSKSLYYQKYLKPGILKKKIQYIVNSHETEIEIMEWLGHDIPALGIVEPALSNAFTEISVPLKFDGPQTIIVVGNDSPHKNIAFLLSALELIEVPCRLITVGIGKKLHISNRKITIDQYLNIGEMELVHLYDSAQFLCVPSLREGFCIPIIEARSRGLGVIHLGISKQVSKLAGIDSFTPDDAESVVSFSNCIQQALSQKESVDSQSLPSSRSFKWSTSAQNLNRILLEWSN